MKLFYFNFVFTIFIGGFEVLAGELEDDSISVAVIHVPPYIDIGYRNKPITGLAVDVTTRLVTQCGLKVRFVPMASWNRAILLAKDGKIDGVIPAHKTEERQAVFDYVSEPVFTAEMVLFARRAGGPSTFQGLTSLYGKRVGVISEALVEKEFNSYIRSNQVTLVEYRSLPVLLAGLVKNRLDFVAGNRVIGRFSAQEQGILDRIIDLEPALGYIPVYLALSKRRQVSAETEKKIQSCLLLKQ